METRKQKRIGHLAPTVKSIGTLARFSEVSRQQVKDIVVKALRDFPGIGRIVDRPRTQPLKSSHVRLGQWAKSEYGTLQKPAQLAETPWDYVKENEDEIPFLGLLVSGSGEQEVAPQRAQAYRHARGPARLVS